MSRVLRWLQSLSLEVDLTELRLERMWLVTFGADTGAGWRLLAYGDELRHGVPRAVADFYRYGYCLETEWNCRPLEWRRRATIVITEVE